MPTYSLRQSLSYGSIALTATENVTADGAKQFDGTVAAGAVDQLIALAFVQANIKAVYILSDKDLVLQTNNGVTPQDTINLDVGVPLVWTPGHYFTNPFAGNVTAIYATNAGADAASLQIYILEDV